MPEVLQVVALSGARTASAAWYILPLLFARHPERSEHRERSRRTSDSFASAKPVPVLNPRSVRLRAEDRARSFASLRMTSRRGRAAFFDSIANSASYISRYGTYARGGPGGGRLSPVRPRLQLPDPRPSLAHRRLL